MPGGKKNNTLKMREQKFIDAGIEFRKEPYSFLKVGLTSRSISKRFKPKEYAVFDKTILLDRKVPAIVGIELERMALEQFSSNRYYLPKGVKFKGCTELFKTDIKSDLLNLLGGQ